MRAIDQRDWQGNKARYVAFMWNQFDGWREGQGFGALSEASGLISASAGEVIAIETGKVVDRVRPADAMLAYATRRNTHAPEWSGVAAGQHALGDSIVPAALRESAGL